MKYDKMEIINNKNEVIFDMRSLYTHQQNTFWLSILYLLVNIYQLDNSPISSLYFIL